MHEIVGDQGVDLGVVVLDSAIDHEPGRGGPPREERGRLPDSIVGELDQRGLVRTRLRAAVTPSVTLAWDDPPGERGTASVLQNDLDLRVRTPDKQTLQPFILDAAKPIEAARTGADRANNIEQVALALPTAGSYVVTVEGHELAK